MDYFGSKSPKSPNTLGTLPLDFLTSGGHTLIYIQCLKNMQNTTPFEHFWLMQKLVNLEE